jgi:hypothetical protein
MPPPLCTSVEQGISMIVRDGRPESRWKSSDAIFSETRATMRLLMTSWCWM